MRAPKVVVKPLTPSRWSDFAALFGARGACDGCWCQWNRRPAAEYRAGRGEGNKRAMRALVMKGPPPGLIAYLDGEPAGWAALGPRKVYKRLETSRILKPVDAREVWSAPCFFVSKAGRGKGLTVALLEAAAAFARREGAAVLEGYPVDPPAGKRPAAAFVWWGLASAFRKAGFREAARRSKTRPIMRRELAG